MILYLNYDKFCLIFGFGEFYISVSKSRIYRDRLPNEKFDTLDAKVTNINDIDN